MGSEEIINRVPIAEKPCLTIKEAAQYYNIGEQKLRKISDGWNCKWVLYVGNKCLIKKKVFEEWLMSQYSI